MGSVGPWGVVFLWSWGIGKAPDSGVLGRISRRKKDFPLRAWTMSGSCVSNPECVKLMISYESISIPKYQRWLRLRSNIKLVKFDVFFVCQRHTHTQNLWPPLAHMFPDKTDTRWCPSSLAKLVNITPITMVYGWYIIDISILTMVIYNMLGIFVVRGLKFHSWHAFLSYGTCSRCLGIPTGDICGHHIHWWHNEAGPQMPVIPGI